MIYLDTAATTKPKNEVIDTVTYYLKNNWFNPSSLYSPSTYIKEKIENAKNNIAKFINANKDEIYFTSGGSESNCWAIEGFVKWCENNGFHPIIVTSKIEHKSIIECINDLKYGGHTVSVNSNGLININELKTHLNYVVTTVDKPYKVLVSIQFANNEIGTIQNIKQITELLYYYNCKTKLDNCKLKKQYPNFIFHTDAVQAFGKINIDVKNLGIDMLSASGHKIGAPKGIGILYKKKTIPISPIIYGTQMSHMRGGTENVPYIMGFNEAVQLIKNNLSSNYDKLQSLKSYLVKKLLEDFDVKINNISGLPNIINVTFNENITGEGLCYLLDLSEIYISTGSACNSLSNKPSHVLKAIGLTDEQIMKTIRISLSEDLKYEDINKFLEELKKQIKLLSI